MVKVFLIFQVFFFINLPLLAQSVDTAWVRRYNGAANDQDAARAIAIDNSGNIYVTGYSCGDGTGRDYVTVKYYPDGDTAWVRRYNGSGNYNDVASSVGVDGYGNIYVTGWSAQKSIYPYNYDYATIKYYPNGDTAWVRRYNGTGNSDDEAFAIAVDSFGYVYVTGTSYGSSTDYDYVTIRYYPNGDTAWTRRYNAVANLNDDAHAIALDDSGNVYVTGKSLDILSYYDFATIKYDQDGNELWVKRYDGPGSYEDGANAIAVDNSGYIYVTGYTYSNGTLDDYTTIKYYTNGDTAWVRRYNGPGNSRDYAQDVTVDGSGNVYVTGRSPGIGSSSDYATIKYDSNGDTDWIRRYDGPGNSADQASAIIVDNSGNVYVTGSSCDSLNSWNDYATVMYYPNGDTAWVKRYNGSGDNNDEAVAIALDGYGNVYVTGTSIDDVTSSDYATIKYIKTTEVNNEDGSTGRPFEFVLAQNYPNPFNPSTTIDYSVDPEGLVQLVIYNILGQKVRSLVNNRWQKGSFSVRWDGRDDKGEELPSGVYFYMLKTRDHTSSKKLVLLK